MDSIVSSALTEIYSQGTNGVSIKDLWPTLETPILSSRLKLCDGVKRIIWNALLKTAGLEFKAADTSFASNDPRIQSFEDAEELNLKIVAAEYLRDFFLGIYDFKPLAVERAVLDRLAVVRTKGITQSQLAKDLGKRANEIFYELSRLEFRGLIVKQRTIVRTKLNVPRGENGENGSENTSAVSTNLILLRRYAKPLNSQERIEITKSEALESLGNTGGGVMTSDGYAEGVKEDVFIKDYLPAMKAVCAILEEAKGKVLFESDIKKSLDYRKRQGHRSWRTIVTKLKQAELVEEVTTILGKKEVKCLRLLKKFDPKCVQPKRIGRVPDEFNTDRPLKCRKQGKYMDQLLELPVEHQIYDLIDAEGGKGLSAVDVCKRLGINDRKKYERLSKMLCRYGMYAKIENNKKCKQYRVFTHPNPPPSDDLNGKHGRSPYDEALISPDKTECWETPSELHCSSPEADERSQMHISESNPHESGHNIVSTALDGGQHLVNIVNVSTSVPSEAPPPSSSKSSRAYPKYQTVMTAVSVQREQRIRERLQEEKFILSAELHKWLESFEKDNDSSMCSKTLSRILSKLEEEGICRCIYVDVPLVTNVGRKRQAKVVLQSSPSSPPNLSPELLSQIHERLRSFEKHQRQQACVRLKGKQVPVLDNVERTIIRASSESQAIVSEAMRANGFVPAKMVRLKLLHTFLWGYVRSSSDWDNALCAVKHGYDIKNPHSTCKIFMMFEAVKAMPLELFLQVVGSTRKIENLVENSKLGLCLAGLPLQEYESLMDSLATTRLSGLVNILCKLKLIRLVSDKDSEDGHRTLRTTLTYAMELNPYIEEPLCRVSRSFGIISSDLRPKRHDFELSNREAVDMYWKTLEYCYSTADPKSAEYAFPGSDVKEVFMNRSWASVRLMTADQRAKLLKRVANDDPNKKISFSDSVKIARDLNLTLEQVLRVASDKRQSRLAKVQNVLNPKKKLRSRSDSMSASRKRKRSLKARSSKRVKLDEQSLCTAGPEDSDIQLQGRAGDEQDDPGTAEEDREEGVNFISRYAFRRRRRKVMWTETQDKELVIQYVRNRAALGARFHGTDWVTLHDLPASPEACKRRMHILIQNPHIRRAVMSLCNLLGERYARCLPKFPPYVSSLDDSTQLDEESSATLAHNKYVSDNSGELLESGTMEQQWDDFEDQNIKSALDEVLRCKRLVKLERRKKIGEEWPANFAADQSHDLQEQSELIPSVAADTATQNNDELRLQRSRRNRIPRRFLKLLSQDINGCRRAFDSLAVANAVELLKLVFLSITSAPEVPNLLAETLRRYSEHDLFAAFNYLREKKFMVGGNGNQPFVLSQNFLHRASSSPFPTNTGKRAAKFAQWLREREQDLKEDAVRLNDDLQCGDLVHLLAMVSSGELFISPSLPDEGIGEAEESIHAKRKAEDVDSCTADNVKRPKPLSTRDGAILRRAKGFPGIKVSVSRILISKPDALELFPNQNSKTHSSLVDMSNDQITSSDLVLSCIPSYPEAFPSLVSLKTMGDESRWEAINSYGNHLLSSFSDDKNPFTSVNPELFKNVHLIIYRAGDQGIRLDEISKVLQGKADVEFVVDVLQVFGLTVKVNAYDDVHIVDASFRSKYFLTTVEGQYQGCKQAACKNPLRKKDLTCPEEYDRAAETNSNPGDVYKVTHPELPEDACEDVRNDELMKMDDTSSEYVRTSETSECMTSVVSHSYRPILPWINGDGTTNPIVYKGLVRRLLGIVMQNPAILEDDIICRMDVLNPQSCRKLLELMILDNHLIVRKMHQVIYTAPPSILTSLCSSSSKKSTSVCRQHFFANPMSTVLL